MNLKKKNQFAETTCYLHNLDGRVFFKFPVFVLASSSAKGSINSSDNGILSLNFVSVPAP